MNQKGFTLLELMMGIVIIGILTTLIAGNFISSLTKGRDAQRKTDLAQLQRVLEIYYEDKREYPRFDIFSPIDRKLCETDGCASTEKVYMQKVSKDPVLKNHYTYQTDDLGSFYILLSCIENSKDTGQGVSQNGYQNEGAPVSCGNSCICKYILTSPNITPLPTISP